MQFAGWITDVGDVNGIAISVFSFELSKLAAWRSSLA